MLARGQVAPEEPVQVQGLVPVLLVVPHILN